MYRVKIELSVRELFPQSGEVNREMNTTGQDEVFIVDILSMADTSALVTGTVAHFITLAKLFEEDPVIRAARNIGKR